MALFYNNGTKIKLCRYWKMLKRRDAVNYDGKD